MKRKRLSGRNNILGMSGKLYQKNLDDGSATRFNLQSDVDGAAEDGGRTSPVPRSGCSRHAVCTVCTSVSHAYTKLIQISTRHRDHRPCQGSSRPILSRVPVTTNSGAAPQWWSMACFHGGGEVRRDVQWCFMISCPSGWRAGAMAILRSHPRRVDLSHWQGSESRGTIAAGEDFKLRQACRANASCDDVC